MLKLSDCELANLRLECWKWVTGQPKINNVSAEELQFAIVQMEMWCLRDRDEPGAGE